MRLFAILNKYNNHYVNEFISTAITADSEILINFAKKFLINASKPIVHSKTKDQQASVEINHRQWLMLSEI